MFKELQPLLAKRSLTITVAALNGEQIRVNVIPHSRPEDTKVNEQIKYSHKDEVAAIPDAAVKALTTPISLTGTAEEIDAKLSRCCFNSSNPTRSFRPPSIARARKFPMLSKPLTSATRTSRNPKPPAQKPNRRPCQCGRFCGCPSRPMIIPHFRAILSFEMTIQTKSMMRRRVNRARPSGLVCP